MKITNKDKEILYYIKGYMLSEGFIPSIRQIGQAVKIKSTSSVHNHLLKLEDAGLIVYNEMRSQYRPTNARWVFEEKDSDI